mmetsp:Transcript_17474/g.48245  ORF Transcript_17474/g.48245 Transcript_17474/m.48245 type:complete len:268 (-) Transcript_17474:1484-2287(-)
MIGFICCIFGNMIRNAVRCHNRTWLESVTIAARASSEWFDGQSWPAEHSIPYRTVLLQRARSSPRDPRDDLRTEQHRTHVTAQIPAPKHPPQQSALEAASCNPKWSKQRISNRCRSIISAHSISLSLGRVAVVVPFPSPILSCSSPCSSICRYNSIKARSSHSPSVNGGTTLRNFPPPARTRCLFLLLDAWSFVLGSSLVFVLVLVLSLSLLLPDDDDEDDHNRPRVETHTGAILGAHRAMSFLTGWSAAGRSRSFGPPRIQYLAFS